MGLRNYLLILFSLLLALLPACYHMRTQVEPIAPRVITVTGQSSDVINRIRNLVEDDWKCRILETDRTGTILTTAPYHFTTDTGFGQPAGGRKYYTQLRIETRQQGQTATVLISHYHFEIRTSYAYNDYVRQGVGTMYKHYPYEEYPGMFDLDLINRELDRVAASIKHLFQEYK